MRWWTSRGPRASDLRREEQALLAECAQRWGDRVCHVWDRGFAGSPWLRQVVAPQTAPTAPPRQPLRWVVRWPGRYKLGAAPDAPDAPPTHKAWEWARGKRSWDHRLVWDARRHVERKVGVLAVPVCYPDAPTLPLWLVVARRGQGQEPWYLLTNEPVVTVEDAWRIVYQYARRCQIELSWRYGKSELAMESPRVWTWERRQKLLLLATLAYAFLLTLVTAATAPVRTWLLRWWRHRTGKRCQAAVAPLYRLRSALSRLW